jgi:hypothetical protein
MDGTPDSLRFDYALPGGRYSAPREILDALAPGEDLLWYGRPSQSLLILQWSDLFYIPFFAMWTGFAIFWEAMALSAFDASGGSLLTPMLCFPLFGLPFVAVGLYMLGARFVGDYLSRRRTFYALTDRRAIIVSGLLDRAVASFALDKMGRIDVIDHRDGRGTLLFAGSDGPAAAYRFAYIAGRVSDGNRAPAFERIENPRAVFDAVMRAQEKLMRR